MQSIDLTPASVLGLILAGLTGMKINNIKRDGPKAGAVKKSPVQSGSFQSLLTSKLETIRDVRKTDVINESPSHASEAWDIIENAAQLLDEAMEQIQKNGSPNKEVVNSLHELRTRLHQGAVMDGNSKEADAMIAVETSRLQTW